MTDAIAWRINESNVMDIRSICLCIGLLAAGGTSYAQGSVALLSPSKNVLLAVDCNGGKVSYKVTYRGTEIVRPSQMLWEVDGKRLGADVSMLKTSKAKAFKTSYPLMGNHSTGRNSYREMTVDVTETNGTTYQMDLRAYDTGVAFRYRCHAGNETVKVDDYTDFTIPTGAVCWMQDNVKCYEAAHRRYEVGVLPEKAVAGPPVTIKYVDGIYSCITEGNLADFGGMSLQIISPDTFRARLEGETMLGGDIATPWRIIMTGDLNSIVNNDIVTDVNPPLSPVFKGNLDWIKPGNCVWSWLAGYGVTLENMKRFSDWAAELGIPYNLVDEGWSHWEDKANGRDCWDMIKELVDYSAGKGVKILLWKAYPDRNGIEGLQTTERRRNFFKKCKDMGIAGLKIDFFDSESQTVTKYYAEAIEDAAKYGLMINFHGSNKPTGLNRTFPNEVAREGIMGLEFGQSWADQDNVTPFTRFVAGHADYTPTTFSMMGNTTEAHQVAVGAIFLCPLRCYGGRPEDFVNHPARDIFLNIPTTWDETIVLPPSEIGDCAVYLHRKGKEWYIAALTDKPKKDISVPLTFLGKGKYGCVRVMDTPAAGNAKACTVLAEDGCTAKHVVTFSMEEGGGFLARLTPQK